MTKTMTLTFKPAGQVQGLYAELIDLQQLGRLHVRRATRIEFDNQKQVWRVRDTDGFPLYTSPSRQTCLDWERRFFHAKEARDDDE